MQFTFEQWNPNVDIVRYLDKWKTLEEYVVHENALHDLFSRRGEDYLSQNDLMIKCSVLNDFYGTNIYEVYHLVKHYSKISNLAQRLEEPPTEQNDLVKELRYVPVPRPANSKRKKDTIDYYSFASKFCSHHNPELFPIYDYYVDRVLREFRNHKVMNFRNDDLLNYSKFVKNIKEFQKIYGLEKYSVKEIDMYLWQLGKECFPIRY